MALFIFEITYTQHQNLLLMLKMAEGAGKIVQGVFGEANSSLKLFHSYS
jgi:hypothetical protein